jgi:hypothetical protein
MYKQEQPEFLHQIPKFHVPLHTIHLDHLGPIVSSTRNNTYLLVAIDGFTKFAFLKEVRNTKVCPVLKILDEIFNMFGVTQRIICDRGSGFTSKRFNEYCNTMGIKVNYTATTTPRVNGQAERCNRTILNALAASTDDERKWDEAVKSLQWGLKTTSNKITGKTPYELLLGYRPRQANDSFLSTEVYDIPHNANLAVTREQTSERIRTKQVQQKARYDLSQKPIPKYCVGKHVLILKVIPTNDGKSKNLLQKYSGPYEIRKILFFLPFCKS